MPQPNDTAYVVGRKYLFKTGFDSYVAGLLKDITQNEIILKDASLQITPAKIEDFIMKGEAMRDHPIHNEMIIARINIDWAVPVR